MSMAPTTEPQSSATDLGQRLFLLGIFGVLVVEALCTITNVGQWFQWTSCIYGILACIVILYLGNWLYTGNKTALTATRTWVVLQFALVLLAVMLLMSTDSTLPGHLGVNAMWQGYVKLAVYLGFAGLLFVPGVTLDFFSAQRGEAPAAASAPVTLDAAAPTGNPVDLAADQTKALEGLAGAMKIVSGVLLTVGAFQVLMGLLKVQEVVAALKNLPAGASDGPTPTAGLLSIVEGIALAGLGAVLLAPSKALQALLEASPRNMGFVMRFFSRLLSSFKLSAVFILVLAVAAVCRLVMMAM